MSCIPEPVIFRLLDGLVGWDPLDATGLAGLDDTPAGIVLATASPEAVDPASLLPMLPPARLATGCGRCAWWLVTPAPSRLLRLACGVRPGPCEDPFPCNEAFVRVPCLPDLVDGVAVAARRHVVAVSDPGAAQVRILGASGEELLAIIPLAAPGPLAFSPQGDLLVATGSANPRLLRFSLSGAPLGEWPEPLPRPGASVDRMAFARDGALWMVLAAADGVLSLWRSTRAGVPAFVRAEVAELAGQFAATTLVASTDDGFALLGDSGGPICWFDGYGRPVAAQSPAPPIARATQGQLLTLPIDSGRSRCRWHRVRIEADVPAGTTLSIAVATSEIDDPPAQGDATGERGWESLPAGVPHPADWESAPPGSLDFLPRQPPGRYLFLRLRLAGNGAATPVVHRIRLDLPRSTSLAHLPPVYREEPRAEEFTERFLSLFDASIETLDRTIERLPALLDTAAVPESVLPWLASFLDLSFEPSWTVERRRALITAAPQLYRQRGTKAGLAAVIRQVLNVEPVIQELAAERAWGALSRNAQLGSVRLFGRSRARFTLGASPLGAAPMRSFGDPALDPLAAAAWRLRVLVPSADGSRDVLQARLASLLDSQKPAHTIVTTRVGGSGLVVGTWCAVGIDTLLAPLPAPVLGGPSGNARLSATTVLWPRRGGSRGSFSVGRGAAIELNTLLT